MIEILPGFNINLEIKDFYINIYTYEYISIPSLGILSVNLPYKRTKIDKTYYFQLNKELIIKGLNCIWNNINFENSKKNLEFLIKNDNIDLNTDIVTKMFRNNKINIKSGTLFGSIFINS